MSVAIELIDNNVAKHITHGLDTRLLLAQCEPVNELRRVYSTWTELDSGTSSRTGVRDL